MDIILEKIKSEFGISHIQAKNTVSLIDEGNTIPFIARYRKEMTGALSDEVLRDLYERLQYLRHLEERREEVTRLIDEQGKLTPELSAAIERAETMTALDDIYRPYRPKRRTRAIIAREKGLEGLADFIMEQNGEVSVSEKAAEFIDPEKEVNTVEDAVSGALDILAENIADNAEYRQKIRELTISEGLLSSKANTDEDTVYSLYYDSSEPVAKAANHRVLAINRGEKEGVLSVKIELDENIILNYLKKRVITSKTADTAEYLSNMIADAYKRLIAPSIETEVRGMLTEKAEEASIKVFNKNLSGLLLCPPIRNMTVMGFDPGYRTGCKIAVVDPTGKVLDTGIVHCTLPSDNKAAAKKIIRSMLIKNNVDLVSIGNGTASKESEIFIADILKEMDKKIYYTMTNEAGASVYSASKLGAEEFPDYDVSLRSAVSIARRVQDPLAELVKIDPKSIGVGQYQHDMNQKRLGEALSGVVESCVNSVGVDLNTASAPLLSYVAGINKTVAKNITVYRDENGKFTDRKQLLKVPKLGKKAFEQCAGFLRIADGNNILDNTQVHPESYAAAKELIKYLGYTEDDIRSGGLSDIKKKLSKSKIKELAEQLGVGELTLSDIADSLAKPGRDPRDEMPKPVLRSDVMGIEDLKPDMVFTGTVRNVIDFGAFVDIGVHQDGLVHISQICDRYIKHPTEVLKVGDIVKVRVLSVDVPKHRISLSMINV